MGIAKSVTYDIADPELGEEEEVVKISFKAQKTGPRDYITKAMNALSKDKLEYFLRDSPKFVRLNAAYQYILNKHGSFPLDKESYETFVLETLEETEGPGEDDSDVQRIINAWVRDSDEADGMY